jgi:hypothetical protein
VDPTLARCGEALVLCSSHGLGRAAEAWRASTMASLPPTSTFMARGEAKGRGDDGSMKGVLSGRGVYRVASPGRGGSWRRSHK